MADPLLVCQQLIDVLAVSFEQIVAVSDSLDHGVKFIHVELKGKPARKPASQRITDFGTRPKSVKRDGMFKQKG